MTSSATPLLEVRDLRVSYATRGAAAVVALAGVSFVLAPGEAVGVLGASGCGKSTLALAILGLLPPEGAVAGGEVRLRGRRLDTLTEDELAAVRGAEIGLVFQDPSLALHPTRRVREQVAEVLRAHREWPWTRCREAALAALAEVELDAEVARAFPHQLSGGQRQRVVIAQAVCCGPALLIADEPATALDAVLRARLLALLRRLRQRHGTALLVIEHDPETLAEVAERILVMDGGRVVEDGPAERVLAGPSHPATAALLRCLPPPLPVGGVARAEHDG